jgi:hypothetical protein
MKVTEGEKLIGAVSVQKEESTESAEEAETPEQTEAE